MTTKTSVIIKPKVKVQPYIGDILISKRELKSRIKELANRIKKDYHDKNPLVIGILKGAGLFLSDLVREVGIDLQIDFMMVSSYAASTKTSGIVRITKDLDEDIEGRHVLIVEDIIDSGLTLSYLKRNLKCRNPASLEICSLLKKKSRQKIPTEAKYLGFEIQDIYVVGYGLDYKQRFRNLKNIRILNNPPKNNGF